MFRASAFWGGPVDPISLAVFSIRSPAAALDLFVLLLLLIAAHGAYALARRFGADRAGAALAGIAFAGSGYIACQLKHLGIISTVVWLPVGLLLLDHAFARRPVRGSVRVAASVHGCVWPGVRRTGAVRLPSIGVHLWTRLRVVRGVQAGRLSASDRRLGNNREIGDRSRRLRQLSAQPRAVSYSFPSQN